MNPIELVLLSLLFYLFFLACQYEGYDFFSYYPDRRGFGAVNYKGVGHHSESLETLLSRAYWVADADGRHLKWRRALIIAVVSGLLLAGINRGTSIRNFLLTVLVVFLTAFSTLQFMRFHSDAFNGYYVRNNLQMVADRIGVSITTPPDPIKLAKVPYIRDLKYVLK